MRWGRGRGGGEIQDIKTNSIWSMGGQNDTKINH